MGIETEKRKVYARATAVRMKGGETSFEKHIRGYPLPVMVD